MSKEITLAEVRVGDTIRISREMEVEKLLGAGIKTSTGIVYDARHATIELLDRPIVLPTEPGTVVVVRTPSFDAPGRPKNFARWFLVESISGQHWTSRIGIRKTPDQFKEFLAEREDRTFEVVL